MGKYRVVYVNRNKTEKSRKTERQKNRKTQKNITPAKTSNFQNPV